MNSVAPQPARSDRALAVFLVALCAFFALIGLAVIGVTGFFRLSPDTSALRAIALSSGGAWQKVAALRVGWITTGLVRTGLSFVQMEPDARAALRVVRGAEVGVYELRDESGPCHRQQVLTRANKEMLARGWERVVTVAQGTDLVAVYVSPSRFSSRNLRCCVLVLQERQMVVAAAQANLEPLLEIARRHLEAEKIPLPVLAKRY